MLMFHWCFHKSWFGAEKCVIQISWFRDLFWRWEGKMSFQWNDVFHWIFISLRGNWHFFQTRNIKADHEAAEHFVLHRGLSTNHRRYEIFWKMVIFVCWLAAKYTLLLLTHFRKSRKTNSMAIATTRASAVVAKTLNDVNQTLTA